MTTLLDANNLEPPSHKRLYIGIAATTAVILLGYFGWLELRFIRERLTIDHFMDAVAAADFDRAYAVWKPHGSYTHDDFLGDWGAQGYYGPIESYQVKSVEEPEGGGSGVIVTVEISPAKPFPPRQDPQSARTREVRLWVERSDQAISFPP